MMPAVASSITMRESVIRANLGCGEDVGEREQPS
jgi:hypothetical protein